MKIAVVAGEASSDLLGAALISDLLALHPDAEVWAVGGKRIEATGAKMICHNEVFSVMGLFEVLKDLPKILKAKKTVVQQILAAKPYLFVGVDAPDLNFSIAKQMRKQGIPVVHYVSPSVWAWRPKRVHKMSEFVNALLTLFPFEVACYRDTSIQARFVGHPLATRIPLHIDKREQKQKMELGTKVLAVLPGSRTREIKTLMPVFAQAVQAMNLSDEWQIVSANVSPEKQALCQGLAQTHGLSLTMVPDAGDLLQAADFALVGSGTVALEAMLCKTPMVVAYRISGLTHFLIKRFNMMLLPYYSLPNVLHGANGMPGEFLVPEVMQGDLTVDNLSQAMTQAMQQDQAALLARFAELHESLLPENPNQAALAVSEFWEQTC